MTEQEKSAVDKIHEFDRFGSILGLERMTELMARLGNPEKTLRVIHVAGTNGKGSVCKYIYEVLQANGYQTGLYTSPFLEEFNERIELGGAYISDEDLEIYTEKVLERVREIVAEGLSSPTEFEVVTAVAFLYFAEKQADYVVLEVGLGGSGDSTNIVERPLISVITSISYDHMDRLGNTLEEIAGEKAGIIKEGVPVVANVDESEGPDMAGAARVIARRTYEKGSVLYDVSKTGYKKQGSGCFDAIICGTDYCGVEISMLGEHQIKNALTALTALEVLRKAGAVQVERSRLYAGMKKAVQIGRFEILQKPADNGAYIVIDGAHNEAGAAAAARTMNEQFAGKKALVITGMLADKEVDKILAQLCEVSGDFAATEPDNPRKLAADTLCARLRERGRQCIAIANIEEACRFAQMRGGEYDVVLFVGSLYLIGKVRGILKL